MADNAQQHIDMQPMPAGFGSYPAAGWNPEANWSAHLEPLERLSQLVIKQKVELLETLTGCETSNKYEVFDHMGQKLLDAEEESNCCLRCCLGTLHPFVMALKNQEREEVIRIYRPYRCEHCLCFCCLQQMVVEDMTRALKTGVVRQKWSPCCLPRYVVESTYGPTVNISGPCCRCAICGNVDFKLTTEDEREVGIISKQWSGLTKEIFTDADKLGITFPHNIDADVKATLLGAVFLIDFMYFEN